MAYAGLQALIQFSPPDLPRISEGIHLDGLTVIGFAAAVTVITGAAFGLVPAIQSSGAGMSQDLGGSWRGDIGSLRRQKLRSGLVMAEVAISLVVLVAAGLMIHSFSRLASQNLGYNPEHLISMGLSLPDKESIQSLQSENDSSRGFWNRRRTLPGIQSAALAAGLPLGDWDSSLYVRVLDAPPPAPGEPVAAGYAQVSPGYFFKR